MKIENAICWLIGKLDMDNEKITKLEGSVNRNATN